MTTSERLIRHAVGVLAAMAICVAPRVVGAQERQTVPPVQERVGAESPGLIDEPTYILRAAVFGDRHFGNGALTNGLYVDSFNMIPGAGWIAAGPGYRHWYSHDRVFVDGSASVSWRGYKTAQGRLEFPRLFKSRLTLGSQARLQDATQVVFFGDGPASRFSNLSEYRLQSRDLVGYATLRPTEWLDVDTSIGWLDPSIGRRAGTFLRDRPDTRDVFRANPVFALAEQPAFVHTGVTITADTRDYPGHPTRGGLVRAVAAEYADREAGLFSFRRYEAEAMGFVPIGDSRVVLALHGWVVGSDTGAGQVVPFYLEPSLGGQNTLRGYSDYRFHDRSLMLATVEARVAIMTHLDGAVFVDAGSVAPRVGDLTLGRRSYGAGIRLHTQRQTFARLDVARGAEGWRFVFRLTEALNPARISRRTAAAPFVP